jgi:hypothetical protein
VSLNYDAMHEISQQLAIGTEYGTWNPTRGYTAQDLTQLRAAAQEAMWDSPVGEELYERGGPAMLDRVRDEFGKRYEGKFPSSTPYFEVLMECAKDMLLELPAPIVAAKATPKPKVAVVVEELPPEPDGKLVQFAHMLNQEIVERGVPKARGGYVTIQANGKGYRYPAHEYETLIREANRFRLLDGEPFQEIQQWGS